MLSEAAAVEARAAQFIARRDAGSWTDSDARELENWLEQSSRHRVAYLRLNAAWSKGERLRAAAMLNEHVAKVEVEAPASASLRLRPLPPSSFGWAAAALAASLLGVAGWSLSREEPRYATAVGGFQRLPLNDGSGVELNTDTRVRVAYGAAERRVELEKGEAFFKVAKNPKRPFVVMAGGYRVIAVGTAFSVRIEKASVDVIVTEGRVRVERSAAAGRSMTPVLLSAGQAGDFGAAVRVDAVAGAITERALSWRDGALTFDDEPLAEIVAEFNRHNSRQLVIADPRIAAISLGGTFKPNNVDGFLRLLDAGFDVKAVPDKDGKRILLKRAD